MQKRVPYSAAFLADGSTLGAMPPITSTWGQPPRGLLLFRRGGHPQGDLGDALADAADGTQAAFVL
jgi:hypothetical protein